MFAEINASTSGPLENRSLGDMSMLNLFQYGFKSSYVMFTSITGFCALLCLGAGTNVTSCTLLESESVGGVSSLLSLDVSLELVTSLERFSLSPPR